MSSDVVKIILAALPIAGAIALAIIPIIRARVEKKLDTTTQTLNYLIGRVEILEKAVDRYRRQDERRQRREGRYLNALHSLRIAYGTLSSRYVRLRTAAVNNEPIAVDLMKGDGNVLVNLEMELRSIVTDDAEDADAETQPAVVTLAPATINPTIAIS